MVYLGGQAHLKFTLLLLFASTLLSTGGAFSQRNPARKDEGSSLELLDQLLSEGAVNHRSSRVLVSPDSFKEGQWHTLFESEGPGIVTHIRVTFPPGDKMLGRRSLLRMYWDDEKSPSVEAPLGDFFGVPFGLTGTPEVLLDPSRGGYFSQAPGYSGPEFHLSSEYLVVAPNNGLNCYFPMPFARSARIELLPEQSVSRGGFYIQVDYLRYPERLPEAHRLLRFHAQFRFENPCLDYGDYLLLDAVGRGALIGVSLAIEANTPQRDFWPHGGGDTLFIDGETMPMALSWQRRRPPPPACQCANDFFDPRAGRPLQLGRNRLAHGNSRHCRPARIPVSARTGSDGPFPGCC